jgi:hypothetical protein
LQAQAGIIMIARNRRGFLKTLAASAAAGAAIIQKGPATAGLNPRPSDSVARNAG